MFYNQFSDAVEQAIQKLLTPVEKDFNVIILSSAIESFHVTPAIMLLCLFFTQDRLSIRRWNDGNYWTVKSSTEKSHRVVLDLINKHKVLK